MAMEPLYYGVIVALIVLAILQQLSLAKWRRAAHTYRTSRDSWKRLAGDYGHHQIGRDHINRHRIEPRFPKGTPEYEAYRAELTTELDKFAAGEAPYEYERERTEDQ